MNNSDNVETTDIIRTNICTFIKSGSLGEGKSRMDDEIRGVCGPSESGIDTCEELSGPTTGTESTVDEERIRNIKLKSESAHKFLAKSTGRYVSDVIHAGSVQRASAICRKLQEFGGLSYKRNLLIISAHDDHVHVAHDCAYSDGTCRCSFIKKTENLFGVRRRRRAKRRRPLSTQLEVSDFQNIITYFDQEGRRMHYLRIGGRVESVPIESQSVEVGGPEKRGTKRSLEACEEMDDAELRREEYEDIDKLGWNRRGCEAVNEKKLKKYTKKNQKMLDLLKEVPMVPISGILNHPLWLADETLQFLNMSDKNVANVLNNWSKRLCTWTIHDFHELYSDASCNPIFSAGYGDMDNYYYDLDSSLQVMIELLEFQFCNDQEAIVNFITDLFNVLERKKPKLNSILIKSPPSGGKNFFFDCIKDYYLNVGYLCSANRFNNFAFQDADGRRLVLWNEPNYSNEMVERIKMLLGGDSTNVSVKYRAEAPIYRTPVILLTNNQLSIMSNPAFKDRMVIYHWTSAPFLKEKLRKPNPLCTYELFKHYGLIKDK